MLVADVRMGLGHLTLCSCLRDEFFADCQEGAIKTLGHDVFAHCELQ